MSALKHVKIADLEPSTRGELALVFEVHEVLQRTQTGNLEAVTCRLVDETGIITAYFDQYASKFTVGTVFEIQNFRCKIGDDVRYLLSSKATVVAKQPLKMGFKDLQNDLSAKFYAPANKNPQGEKIEQQEVLTKQEEPASKIKQKTKKADEKQRNNSKEETNKGSKDKKQKQTSKRGKQEQRKQSHQHQQSEKEVKKQEKKEKKYVQKQETTAKGEKQQQPVKQKKEESQKDKKKDQSDRQGKKPKFIPKCEQIKLAECPKWQEDQASFVVRVNLQTAIKKEKYFMCKVSDPSGSTYFEFHPSMAEHLKDKAWYRLIAFRVFKDRDYGFIATQERHSTYELLSNWDEKSEAKLLWR